MIYGFAAPCAHDYVAVLLPFTAETDPFFHVTTAAIIALEWASPGADRRFDTHPESQLEIPYP